MARPVTVSGFQQMQRGESDAIDPAAEDAAATARLKAIGCGPDEPKAEDRAALTDPWPHGTPVTVTIEGREVPGKYLTIQDHGAGPVLGVDLPSVNLDWGIGESGLHWLAPEQVRTNDDQSDDELGERLADRAEDLAKNLGGPREYDVVDGEVRDWRRPDPGPARDPFEPPVHQVGDDDSADEDEDLYPVPTALSFGDLETKEGADLHQIGQDLIDETEDFPHLRGKVIEYVWAKQGGSASLEATVSQTRRLSKHERRTSRATMMVVLAADHLRDMRVDRDTVVALVHERLCAIARSKKGALFISKPNFHGYTKNVERFGAKLPKVRIAAEVLSREINDIRTMRLPFDGPSTDINPEDLGDAGSDLEDLPTDAELDSAP